MYTNPNQVHTHTSVTDAQQVTLSPEMFRQRARNQENAHRMVLLAMRQWERAIGGLLAIPSALAVTTAAGAMLVTSVVERSFEIVEHAAADVGRRVGRDFDANGEPRINARPIDDRRPDAAA